MEADNKRRDANDEEAIEELVKMLDQDILEETIQKQRSEKSVEGEGVEKNAEAELTLEVCTSLSSEGETLHASSSAAESTEKLQQQTGEIDSLDLLTLPKVPTTLIGSIDEHELEQPNVEYAKQVECE